MFTSVLSGPGKMAKVRLFVSEQRAALSDDINYLILL